MSQPFSSLACTRMHRERLGGHAECRKTVQKAQIMADREAHPVHVEHGSHRHRLVRVVDYHLSVERPAELALVAKSTTAADEEELAGLAATHVPGRLPRVPEHPASVARRHGMP